MPRAIFEEKSIHPSVQGKITNHFQETIQEVKQAIETNPVVIVGMAINPYPKRARKMLDEKGISYKYLEYGSYFAEWRRRTALKMWLGWPTFPMVFVKGTFLGGAEDLQAALNSGEFQRLLNG